jgi:predicted Zn-ribbon and HTH transcriptional regulator
MAFIIACSNKIIKAEIDGMLKKSFILSTDILDKVKEISKVAREVIALNGVPLSDTQVVDGIMKINDGFTKNQTLNLLGVLDGITRNKFSKWGFSNWTEINPKGTKERIYLILKEKKKPLHFMQIAKFIDESGISKRKSHPQTVHNELIKDDRFVLIGRGIYALREWGYAPGTIRDVIENILRKNNKPMTKEELLEEIVKFRQVKKTTVMINLNNKNEFSRRNDKYFLKK